MAKMKKEAPQEDFEAFLQKVGGKIRKLRIAKGYSNYEHFAYDHDIARAQYGKYEQGRDDLRLSSLYKVLKSLGITFEDFFKDDF